MSTPIHFPAAKTPWHIDLMQPCGLEIGDGLVGQPAEVFGLIRALPQIGDQFPGGADEFVLHGNMTGCGNGNGHTGAPECGRRAHIALTFGAFI